jgi:hypothetical protein
MGRLGQQSRVVGDLQLRVTSYFEHVTGILIRRRAKECHAELL